MPNFLLKPIPQAIEVILIERALIILGIELIGYLFPRLSLKKERSDSTGSLLSSMTI
ncbi:MAG: hypothetical protein PHX21_04760 [bacterium]|nr:hypothetical protein [bacterium]